MPTPYSIPALRQTILLADQPFATGGEGALYRLIEPVEWTHSVVKLLHPRKRTPARANKAQYLIQHPPVKALGDATLAWLQHLIYDEAGQFVGYLMPYVKGDQLELLTTATLPKRLAADWTGWEHGAPQAKPKRLMMGYHLAVAVYELHQTRRYILADLKPDNILVQPNGALALVDTDSLAVVEKGQSLFSASVATPEYTPPEYLSKAIPQPIDETWDRFSLAVILYRLLLGVHPFAASAKAPYDQLVALGDKIEAGLFVQAPAISVQFSAIPPLHQRFDDLDPTLQTLFIRAFQAGHTTPNARPTAEEWATALAQSHTTCSVHAPPSGQLPTFTENVNQWYRRVVDRLVEEHRVAQPLPHDEELPSMVLWRRIQYNYRTVIQRGKTILLGTRYFLVVSMIAMLCVCLVELLAGANFLDLFTNFIALIKSFGDLLAPVLSVRLLLLLLLLPFLAAVGAEALLSFGAWRQNRGWQRLPWQALGQYPAKRLKRWHERLFQQRSKLRDRLRDLKKEQSIYRNIKRERERLLEEQYSPQLQEARLELSDHLRALQEALDAYDQRAQMLRTAECEALLAATDSKGTPFPALLEDTASVRTIKAEYARQHATLLAEAQATYTAHQQVLEMAFQQWSERVQLPQQLLDTDYCRVLRKINELNHSVNEQQRTLIELDGRLQALRKVLR